jgi:FtsH-binding integral membrane protein
MNILPVKQVSGWLPIAMSLTALIVVLGHIAMFGTAQEPDEGAAAHIWQLLMAAQFPVVAFFAIKWLPRTPKKALPVFALQVGVALTAVAPVYLLGL